MLHLGRFIETGSTEDFVERTVHPYTVALISASPRLAIHVQGMFLQYNGQSHSQFPWIPALG